MAYDNIIELKSPEESILTYLILGGLLSLRSTGRAIFAELLIN